MTTRRLRIQPSSDRLEQGIAAIKAELQLPLAFPPEVEAAAAQAAANPRMPALDRTDIAFVTIDPPGAMDLDQAMFVERRDGGYRVYYAIADVAAFVAPADPVDIEANRRGETLYGADAKVPLYPKVLSEGAASLLPDQVRPALLWTIDLDATGEGIAVDVRRARVRSRAKLDYTGVQATDRCRQCRPDVGGAARDRRAAQAARAQARRRQPAVAGAGGVREGRAAGRWSSARAIRSRTGTSRSRC